VPAGDGRLSSEARGEIEKKGDLIILRRVHVTYHLKAGPGDRETVERVHGFHAGRCPVAQSIAGCVEVTTSMEMEEA
jgi:uncharacterized OsmC-like protein